MSNIITIINNQLTKVGLKPLHPCTIAFYYAPLKGCVSYSILSTQMLNPEVYQNFKFLIVPRYISLTNCCLANSMLGFTLYLFSRRHLQSTPAPKRIAFCAFGSSVFNLGSLLLWALGRTVLPNCTTLRFIVAISGSVGVMYFAKTYIDVIDSQIPPVQIHKKEKV